MGKRVDISEGSMAVLGQSIEQIHKQMKQMHKEVS